LFVWTNIPFYKRIQRAADQNNISPWMHKGYLDYFAYITFIREGRDGGFTVPALYTTEASKSTSIYSFYIFLGKIAKYINITPIEAYHLARIITLEIFLMAIYLVAIETVGFSKAFWPAVAGLYSSPPIFKLALNYLPQVNRNLNGLLGGLDPLRARLDLVPHQQFGEASMLIAVYFLIKFWKKGKTSNYIFLCLWSFLTSLVFSPPALIILTGIPLAVIWVNLMKVFRQRKINYKDILLCIGPILVVLIGLIFIKIEMSKGFPWSQWLVWDISIWNTRSDFEKLLFLSGGLVFAAALPSALKNLIEASSYHKVFLSFWMLLPFLLDPFADLLGLAKIRFAYMVQFVPNGILAFNTIRFIAGKLNKKIFQIFIYTAAFLIFCVTTYEAIIVSYQDFEHFHTAYEVPSMYILPNVLGAIDYLDKYAKPYSTVLSDEQFGLIMPAYARIRVYFGHEVHTQQYWRKLIDVVHPFFKGTMDPVKAQNLIKGNKIDYVFCSPVEFTDGCFIHDYGLNIETVYDTQDVKLYKIGI